MGIEGTRVLLVEDEAIIAMTVEDMLEALGCETVATATTLREALAVAETASFDLALLDINLNGDESLPVAARLRARGLPFVFTTGYGPSGAGAAFADVPLVTKPFDLSDLASAIAVAVRQQP